MKERPILFSTEMVKAILDGKKTQTRRIVKLTSPRLEQFCIKEGEPFPFYFRRQRDAVWDSFATMDDLAARHCPYGKPGDLLWVRETWAHLSDYQGTDPGEAAIASGYFYRQQTPEAVEKWRPSIFMPRKACRTVLKVESVKIERLQGISDADAMAEGVNQDFCPTRSLGNSASVVDWIKGFQILWDGINGKRGYPWDSNPLVWVIKFAPTRQY
jgi:hypothetical protein